MAGQDSKAPVQVNDDALTVCAISLLAANLADVVHEGWVMLRRRCSAELRRVC